MNGAIGVMKSNHPRSTRAWVISGLRPGRNAAVAQIIAGKKNVDAAMMPAASWVPDRKCEPPSISLIRSANVAVPGR